MGHNFSCEQPQALRGNGVREEEEEIGDAVIHIGFYPLHTLLKQEEEPVPRVEDMGVNEAFSILDKALNRKASRRDPQGIVRR